MSPVEKLGFMGEEAEKWAAGNLQKYGEWFALAMDVNVFCHSLLPLIKLQQGDGRSLLLAVLYTRALETWQASVLLASRGMEPAANIVLRSLLETCFIMGYGAKDAESARKFIDSSLLFHEREDMKRSLKYNEEQGNQEAISRLKELIERKTAEIERTGAKSIPISTLATESGFGDWYRTAYIALSQATHSRLSELSRRYIHKDADGKPQSIDFGPRDEGLDAVLMAGVEAIMKATKIVGTHFALPDDARFSELADRYEVMARRLSESM